MLCVSSLALSGCTFADSTTNNGKAAPPGAAAAAAVPTGPTPMDAFRALAPPEGMKFTPLFSVPAASDDARFDRLEQSVQTLRNDFDTVTPTLVRLAAIEKDIRDLVGQLRTLTDGGPIVESVPVPSVEAAAVTAPPAPVAPAPPTTSKTTTTTTTTSNKIPGEGTAGGTDPAAARMATAGPKAPSSPVTPEAASTGQLPPDGAASPSSAAKPAVKPAVAAPVPTPAPTLPPEPLQLTPVAPKGVPAQPVPLKPVTPPVPAAVTAKPASAPAANPSVTPPPTIAAAKSTPPAAAPAPTPTPTPTPAATPTAPAPPPPPAPALAALPTVTMGPILGDVREVRVGDHIDKTRIVLDASIKAPYKVTLDATGKRLLIELPQYAWKDAATWQAPTTAAALVSGYTYKDGLLVMDLSASAVIREQTSIAAANGAGERIVIDLYASAVHTE